MKTLHIRYEPKSPVWKTLHKIGRVEGYRGIPHSLLPGEPTEYPVESFNLFRSVYSAIARHIGAGTLAYTFTTSPVS